MRLTRARAKNGLSGRAIQSTRACRGSSSGLKRASGPSGYFGSGGLHVSGSFSPVVTVAEGLAAQPREEAGKAIIIALAPALEGVMMAAGTLQADAKEHLGRVGGY